ncbi:TPA: hypothetical protein SMF89_004871 [Serratia marcescens]|jgi:hypothetical protein|nr:hypothetical protein SME13J_51180 [Serratia marcescens]HEJ7174836.1 hypothetical protein [Serratia marcescens]
MRHYGNPISDPDFIRSAIPAAIYKEPAMQRISTLAGRRLDFTSLLTLLTGDQRLVNACRPSLISAAQT